MALSRIVAIGNGTATQFSIPFALGYIKRSDVTCRVGTEQDGSGNPIYRTMTWLGNELVSIAGTGTVPGVGQRVTFTRTVDRQNLIVNYEDGDIINEENMNTAQRQAIMLVHEVLDGRFEAFQSNFDLGGFQIKNLGAPTDATDAVNKAYVDSVISTGASNAAAAAASAAAAAVSAGTASSAATAAGGFATAADTARAAAVAAATAAAGSQTAAGTSATNAAASATEALGYRNTANTAATNAGNSATAASGSATTAGTSATNAANSATASGTARDQSVAAKDLSVSAKDTAVAAKDTTVAAVASFNAENNNSPHVWTATAGQTVFTGGTATPARAVAWPGKPYCDVKVAGRSLHQSEFSVSGLNLTLTFATTVGEEVELIASGARPAMGVPGAGTITSNELSNGAVDNTKLANMATKTIKGRTSAGTGVAEDLTIAQVKTDLALPFTKEYVSAPQALTQAGLLTLAHGMATVPKLIQLKMRCVTANQGWSVGDEIYISLGNDNSAQVSPGSMYADATNLYLRAVDATNPFPAIVVKGTGVRAGTVLANWNLVVMAWA